MRKRASIGILGGLLSVLLVFGALPVSAAPADTARDLADGILAWKQGGQSVQAWIDGDLADAAGITAEWYVFALAKSGEEYDLTAYRDALTEYLAAHTVSAAATRQKFALAYLAAGQSHAYVLRTVADSIGEGGIMSLVFGLHLLRNGCVSDVHTVSSVTEVILQMQCADGGWSLSGEAGDADVTAMAVQALAPGYGTEENVTAAVDRALDFLSRAQTERGGYTSYGVENAESAAQVLLALSALGIDAAADARFVKDGQTLIDAIAGFRLDSGAIAHEAGGAVSESASSQSLLALTAYLSLTEGGDGAPFLFGLTAEQLIPPPEEEIPPEDPAGAESGYKPWAILGICAAGGAVCLLLILMKKRHPKNFLTVAALTAAGILFILLTDFQTPDQYYGAAAPKEDVIGTVTVTIRCDTVAGRADHIPADGVILADTAWEIADGDTVYGILTEIAQKYRIQWENDGTAEMAYIVGIGHLYAMDYGDLSGWVYHVNGVSPSVGCGEYVLADGDRVEWLYSCDLGEDVK